MREGVTSTLSPLDPGTSTPLYRQLAERLRSGIVDGQFKPGDRVPSARALAKELGLARGTIETAYGLLIAEGYLQARGQAGTVVATDLGPGTVRPSPPPRAALPTSASFRADSVLPFQMGLPALDVFPRKTWARLGARAVRAMPQSSLLHPDVFGLPALRSQLARYLQLSRGIACTPEQIFITSGYRPTIQLIAETLLKPQDQVWLEDPGYPPTRQVLERLGIVSVAVPVDGEGLDVAAGIERASDARAALVTPAHQSPLCVSLSLSRRLALLDWARQKQSWIIEDDYDGEYRYVSRPLPALKSLDHDGRVIYAGTFSKVLFPGIRLAYIVVPPALVARFETSVSIFAGGSPELTQSIVAAFMSEGHFIRHIQKMRRVYAERRAMTIAGLTTALGQFITIDTPPGGMHLILRLPATISDRALADRMRAAGLFAEALSEWTTAVPDTGAILVNFTNVTSEAMAHALGLRIAQLL